MASANSDSYPGLSLTCRCTKGWTANHNAFANGDNNLWALDNTPFSIGFFMRQDVPTHFGIAEGWTIADMYSQSVVASTIPNRGTCSAGHGCDSG
jgi:phospholipase C